MLQKGDKVKFIKEKFENLNSDEIDFAKTYICNFDECERDGKRFVYLKGFRLMIGVDFLEKV